MWPLDKVTKAAPLSAISLHRQWRTQISLCHLLSVLRRKVGFCAPSFSHEHTTVIFKHWTSLFFKIEQQNFNLYLEPRREMILASLWFPLFYMEAGKKIWEAVEDTAGAGSSSEGSPWHKVLPSHKASHDLQQHKDNSTPRALTHHRGHPQEEKAAQIRENSSTVLPVPEREGTLPRSVRHPRHLPRTIWVPQSPNLPAWPLPSPHPTATPRVLTAAEQSLFHREPAHGSREHSRWWTSVASRSRNPNQVTAEAEWKPAQDCLWEALDSPRPGSAVNVF